MSFLFDPLTFTNNFRFISEFFFAERTPKRVYKIKSASSRCCLWWCWSSSSVGHHCMLSTPLLYSIKSLCIRRWATRPSATFNCLPIRRPAVIPSPTVSWTAAFEKRAWTYFVVANDSTRRDVSASAVVQLESRRAVMSHSWTALRWRKSTFERFEPPVRRNWDWDLIVWWMNQQCVKTNKVILKSRRFYGRQCFKYS